MHLRYGFIALTLIAQALCAQEIVSTHARIPLIQPSAAPAGGSGLINLLTLPANPTGTLGISLHGFYLRHDVRNSDNENVALGMLSLTYSLTRNLEGYYSCAYYSRFRGIDPDLTLVDVRQGIGSQEIGAKYCFPLRRVGVYQTGITAGFILGTSERKVTGFAFLNTRRQSDVKLRWLQTLRLQDHYRLPNLHCTIGYLTQYGSVQDLLIFGAGSDYFISDRLQLMAEFQSLIEQRTPIYLRENFMALTGALRYYFSPQISLDFGGNFGLSQDRRSDDTWRRSDPWQIFAGLTITTGMNTGDLDHDGIPDWLDAENNLPLEYPRNALGQLLDTDLDGVPDYLDQEPTTPRGAVVDARGVALDDDRDGVPDGIDREPRTPVGAWVDALGVAYDRDRDGVPDGIDEEPGSPYGAVVNHLGVALDGDGDGVPDGIDLEPNTPAETVVDAWGRSVSAQAAAAPMGYPGYEAFAKLEAGLLKLSNMHFDLGKADIKPEDYSTLDVVGKLLTRFPDLVILIEGHADSTGSYQRNLELSYQRARAVRDYLLAKFPALDRSNFTVTGLGEMDPLADDGTTEGRIQNRRVEFKILNREKIQEMITTWE